MFCHTRFDWASHGARSDVFIPVEDEKTGLLKVQKHPRGENPFLEILIDEELDMDDEVEAIVRDNPQFEWIDTSKERKDRPMTLAVDVVHEALSWKELLMEQAACIRQAHLRKWCKSPSDQTTEEEATRKIFIGLVRTRFRQDPYMTAWESRRKRTERSQDHFRGAPLSSSLHTSYGQIGRTQHMDFTGYSIPKKPRESSGLADAQSSQTVPASRPNDPAPKPAISDMGTSSRVALSHNQHPHTRRPLVHRTRSPPRYRARSPPRHRARSPAIHHTLRKRSRTTTQSTAATQNTSQARCRRDINSLDQLPLDIRRRLPHLEDPSGSAHFQMGKSEEVLVISPQLPLPRVDRRWLEHRCWDDIESEMRRIDVAHYKPLVPDLVALDDKRHEEHMELQHEPLLWELPPQMVAAARRVFVDGSDKASAEEETRVGRNVKARRRMEEPQSSRSSARGFHGTAEATATWAFVWARRNGLLEELRHDDGYRGYPILPAVVATLVIERAIGGKGRSWEFLLWRAIFSERIRRRAELHFLEANGRLPVWTSKFSNEAWSLYVGSGQNIAFSFAPNTQARAVNELDQRFHDARVAFKRTLRYWRWKLFTKCLVNSMPSLEECGIPSKSTIEQLTGSPLSGHERILTSTDALQDRKTSQERRNGHSSPMVAWARPLRMHHLL